jgi:hypothetical protein
MQIESIQSIRVENWGNTGPARIAPLPNSGDSANRTQPVQPRATAVKLPYLRAFALPEVDAPDIDVQRFASMTAALLKRMEPIRLWQDPSAEAALVDLTA